MPGLRLPHWVFLFVALVLSGCYTATPTRTPAEPPTRSYARTTHQYQSFPDAEALAAYLRANSEAGPLISAHRGGPVAGYPENALATFDNALRYAPVLIECDVRLTRDDVLVLMHDETLDRTTTGSGDLLDYSFAELRRLLLRDERGATTSYRIPTLAETLAWSEGRAVLTLDIKREVPIEPIVDMVRRYRAENRVVLIAYTLDELLVFHELAPDLMLSASVRSAEEAEALLASNIDLSRIIAFTGVSEINPEVIAMLHEHNIRAMLGTFSDIDAEARRAGPDVYRALIDQGIDILATDLVPLAARAIRPSVRTP